MRDGLGCLLVGVERIGGGVGGRVPFGNNMESEQMEKSESESEMGGVLVSVLKR